MGLFITYDAIEEWVKALDLAKPVYVMCGLWFVSYGADLPAEFQSVIALMQEDVYGNAHYCSITLGRFEVFVGAPWDWERCAVVINRQKRAWRIFRQRLSDQGLKVCGPSY